MAVRASERPRRTENARIIPFPVGEDGAAGPAPAREVVAVVLSDGTVRTLGREPTPLDERPFATGQVSGDGWILWWQRRSFDEER
ncbi:MAG: hypothetical protein ACRDI0_11095 [Actinomycetota bacterium]